MTVNDWFQIVNLVVLPQWLLMVVAPKWGVTKWLIKWQLIPLGLSLGYTFMIFVSGGIDFEAFSSLELLSKLFSDPFLVLLGWVHYLAFDLFVGSWILKDSEKYGIHHGLVIPCLLCCFMLGPVGFLLYQLIRRIGYQVNA